MKMLNKHIVSKICVIVGACLLLVGAFVLVSWQWNIHTSLRKTESYVETLRALIPDPQGAVPEERRDNDMSVLSIEGTDFVGILEMPSYELALPVCAKWGKVTNYPCRFAGSVYDRTMQIGATTQKGQFDFYREISVGDTVLYTDTEGNRYTYTVTSLRYEKHADKTSLSREESDLTIFVKNIYAFEYLIISCRT